MSDTPRTNANKLSWDRANEAGCSAAFAEELERENADLHETIKNTEQLLREAIADAARFATENQMFRDQAHDAQRRSNEAFVELRELRSKLADAIANLKIAGVGEFQADFFLGDLTITGKLRQERDEALAKLADAERERDEAIKMHAAQLRVSSEFKIIYEGMGTKFGNDMAEWASAQQLRANLASEERDAALAEVARLRGVVEDMERQR